MMKEGSTLVNWGRDDVYKANEKIAIRKIFNQMTGYQNNRVFFQFIFKN